ncbi:hypothetical protein C4B68_39455 [Streptomyces dengpaensis]|uniref:Uncharacterized protein n=1 Tax=Streptomyces dengpaensis TaxID=2049881 RepID=A0ABN5ICP5_9ACTN|nr:hypothetical protein C4B68_39455 [Streptomyces dengpaensis]
MALIPLLWIALIGLVVWAAVCLAQRPAGHTTAIAVTALVVVLAVGQPPSATANGSRPATPLPPGQPPPPPQRTTAARPTPASTDRDSDGHCC